MVQTLTKSDPARVQQVKPPVSVPHFMLKNRHGQDRVFNPKRALYGAVRMGNTELARKLIEEHGIKVDKDAMLRKAELNRALIRAVDVLDVSAVQSLLEQGADPNSATWNNPVGRWFTVITSAHIVSRSLSYDETRQKNAASIVRALESKGTSFSLCDKYYDEPDD